MGRSPCCVKEGLNRGAWTSMEDKILKEYIKVHGEGKWRSLPKRAGLKRCGKSCRLRWLNYLRPDIKRGNITDDEEDLIIRLHKLLGNSSRFQDGPRMFRKDINLLALRRWSLIAGRLPGRTDNEIKNYWNTNISKRVEGYPSSSNSRKPEAKKNLSNNKTQVLEPPLSKKEGSYVVRTKASRCTKVFINAEIEQAQQLGIMGMKGPSIITTDVDFEKTGGEEVTQGETAGASPTFSKEDNFSDLIMDFEMDDKFLSEFLVTPFDFDMGIADNLTTPNDASSSHESSQNALLNAQEGKQGPDLGSMASLLDPALDWLHDE